jgi:DCC1-like thiol-disulfide oxidoreductase
MAANQALAEMYVRQGTNRLEAGLDGYILLGRSLPLLAPLAALASLPGIHAAGNRVYRAIARRRARTAGCAGGICGIHQDRENAGAATGLSVLAGNLGRDHAAG